MQDDLEPVRSCLGADQLGMTRAVLEAVASRAVASAADLKSFVCCTLLHHAGQVAARPAAVLCPALPRALAAEAGLWPIMQLLTHHTAAAYPAALADRWSRASRTCHRARRGTGACRAACLSRAGMSCMRSTPQRPNTSAGAARAMTRLQRLPQSCARLVTPRTPARAGRGGRPRRAAGRERGVGEHDRRERLAAP